jgi:hypothetical protein
MTVGFMVAVGIACYLAGAITVFVWGIREYNRKKQ